MIYVSLESIQNSLKAALEGISLQLQAVELERR